MRVGLVVGEPSGDKLAAELIKVINAHYTCEIAGILGPELRELNANCLFDMEEICVMGFIEPIKILPKLIRIRKKTLEHFLDNPPDIFIGVDAPDFTLPIEKKLKENGIKVVHYVSPSVWAWRQKRIHFIKKCVDLMLVLFPFEEKIYKENDIPVKFIGHPFAQKIHPTPVNNQIKKIVILPGSRKKEIKNMLPIFNKVAKKCLEKENFDIKIAVLTEKDKELARNYSDFEIVVADTYRLINQADAVLVTSGTATLEVMLFNKPMIIAYNVNFLAYHLLKLIVKTKFIGLPNIIANKMIVPEYIGYSFDIEKMSENLLKLLKENNIDFSILNKSLFKNSSQNAAKAVLELVYPNESLKFDFQH